MDPMDKKTEELWDMYEAKEEEMRKYYE